MKLTALKTVALTILSAALFCSCTSVDWSLPEGYDHNSRRETVRIRVEDPEIVGWINVSSSLKRQFREVVMGKFLESSRFIVLSGTSGTLAGSQDFDTAVKPTINFSFWTGGKKDYARCETVLTVKFKDPKTGVFDNTAFDLKGKAKDKWYFGLSKAARNDSRIDDGAATAMVSESYSDAYKQLEKAIVKRFPVNGRIDSIKNANDKTEFGLAAGTNYGFESSDEILVYSVDNENNVTVVALTKGMVGKNHSQLKVREWNFDDPEVETDIYPRILKGDKTLKLFAVARKKK